LTSSAVFCQIIEMDVYKRVASAEARNAGGMG
jgi:hypothetical protein